MKLGLYTTFWKRWDLSQIFLDYWNGLQMDGVEFVRAAAFSDDGNDWPSVLKGWRTVRVPNRPLGAKHNAGIALLDDCDAVLCLNSDGFASPGWVRYGANRMEHTQFLSLRSIYMYSVKRAELILLLGTPVGSGRFLHREALERLNWAPWEGEKNQGLDSCVINKLGPSFKSFEYVNDIRRHSAMMLDVKTDVNMWSYTDMLVNHGWHFTFEVDTLNLYLPDEIVTRIQCV